MGRVFMRAHQEHGTANFILSTQEISSMLGLFSRAGVDASMTEKISSHRDEVVTDRDCRSFAQRIRLVLSLRMVLWNEEEAPKDPDEPRSITPKLISRTIDRPMRLKCLELADFLSSAALTHGCFVKDEDALTVRERLKK